MQNEGRELYELDSQHGEKMCLKMLEDITWSQTSSDGECFLAENNLKGNATARWALFTTEFEWSQPCKVERK